MTVWAAAHHPLQGSHFVHFGSRTASVGLGGVQLLAPLLRSGGAASHSQQLLYETTLCIWQLSFLQAAAEAMATGVVPGLVETARTAAKEKVHCCQIARPCLSLL